MRVSRELFKIMKLLSVLVLTGVLFTYAMFQGGYVSWFLFYSVVIVVLFHVVFLLYPLRWVTVERTVSGHLHTLNEPFDMTITLRKKFPFPFVYLSIIDDVPAGLDAAGSFPGTVYFFKAKKEIHYTYKTQGAVRGVYEFSEVTLAAGDLFGFYQKEYVAAASASVVVLPEIRPLHQWPPPLHDEEDSVVSVSKLRNDTLSVAGVREYAAGDKLTSIDWKVSARAGKLVTKEFESQEGKGMMILLENSEAESSERFERQVELAASFADFGRKENIRTGFALTADNEPIVVPGSNKRHFQEIFKELARAGRNGSSSPISSSFHNSISGNVIVYITSRLSEARYEELKLVILKGRTVLIGYIGSPNQRKQDTEMLRSLRGRGVLVYFARERRATSPLHVEKGGP
ncbi:DUF58 domain-containing protein [Bacillus piscicola]|uniref:DUF58 domain-containing protein n=1 Tax=Bacillus piscicola TaxID=1632684 RepID=UPI001F0956F3|nr:DUF58 domain-containing protein [Bacillus piscicola]